MIEHQEHGLASTYQNKGVCMLHKLRSRFLLYPLLALFVFSSSVFHASDQSCFGWFTIVCSLKRGFGWGCMLLTEFGT